MKFLIDRCAGGKIAVWLREQGHDVLELRELGKDPGDAKVLARAVSEERVLVTIDTDFGELIYAQRQPHAGLVRLPDVRGGERIALMEQVLMRHQADLEHSAIVTVRGRRIRVSLPSAGLRSIGSRVAELEVSDLDEPAPGSGKPPPRK